MVPPVGRHPLSSDTLEWLLDPGHPSARYLTLTHLLQRSDDDPEVLATRTAIPRTAPAREILRAQYPQGYWMHPGIGYSPRYRATIWQILFLAQLGTGRIEALDRAVGHLFEANQREEGPFRASKESGDTPIGLNGSLLWALERLGYGDAPQVTKAWAWLADEVERRGFDGPTGGGDPCPWGAVKVLWAVNGVSGKRRTPTMEGLGRVAAERLLRHPPAPERDDPRWFRLAFPLAQTADLLQWLGVLVDAGYGDDPRLALGRRWLERKRLPGGAWPLERSPGKLWCDAGEVGKPNRWVTIRALATYHEWRPIEGAGSLPQRA